VSLFRAAGELGAEHHVGRRGLERLQEFTAFIEGCLDEARPPGEVVAAALARAGYPDWLREGASDAKVAERRLQNVTDLTDWMSRLAQENPGEGLAEVVSRLALQDILERQDEDRQEDRVSLMTLHAAKGLEFPHVFLVGMEEDLLPHHGAIGEAGLQEERRLCYVGMTRAQRTLTFSLAAKRRRFGDWESREPSRFLAELPADALRWEGTRSPDQDPDARRERGQRHIDGLRALLQSG
jgi:ATP-dependent DNA helicase Rep